MSHWLVVLLKIAAMFLVILTGWVARRKGALSDETTSTLSRFVVDITIPALIFVQMLRTVTPETLAANWFTPLIGGCLILIGQFTGLALMRVFAPKEQRSTFVFLVAVANWVYLPLPIAAALYGDEGVRVVLLFNVGAQLILWSVGVWTLRGGKPNLESLRNLATNTGLIATALGIVAALCVPELRALLVPDGPLPQAAGWLSAKVVLDALSLVGDLTIPLSLIVTGAQLGGLDLSDHRPSWTLTGVLGARLLLVPVVAVALIALLSRVGVTIDTVPRMIGYITIAMPVAVSCSIFTERFGGDTSLAARSIFISTLLSILTVPAFFFLVQQLGW